MARNLAAAKLHLLTAREVLAARDGDMTDGGGLLLRALDPSVSWVFRFTSTSGRRREMGMGAAMRATPKQAGESLTAARTKVVKARELLGQGIDPIDEREGRREAAQNAEVVKKANRHREQLTLCRAARYCHERVIEPSRTTNHAAQWIASLEHHVPAALWHLPIADVTAPTLLAGLSTVRALANSSERVPETLQRVRQRLDAVFEDAIFHGHCTTNSAAAIRRKMREAMPKKQAGQHAALPYVAGEWRPCGSPALALGEIDHGQSSCSSPNWSTRHCATFTGSLFGCDSQYASAICTIVSGSARAPSRLMCITKASRQAVRSMQSMLPECRMST